MTRTALLIGSDYGGLKGVTNDLVAMEALLSERGFTTRLCGPGKATRAAILAEYETLIAESRPADAIVVYYTGHGGFAEPSGVATHGPVELQYILPIDFDESDGEDFHGIASVELSVLQARLTAVTLNVTVILDCCHSGLMSRDSEGTLKSMSSTRYTWVRAHLDRLAQRGLRTDLVPSEGNVDAVRIVACAPEQRAYEYPGVTGAWTGVLTESLTMALAAVGSEPVTWETVVDWVRQRVVGLGFTQRPEAEGPSQRLLFRTEEADLLHSLPVMPLESADRVRLDCAPLLRVQHDDEFMIMPAGHSRADREHRVGDLTIDAVSAMSAGGAVTFAPEWSAVPLGARAFRTKVTAPQLPIRVPAEHSSAGLVRDAFREAALARPAEPGEQDWAGEVRIGTDGSFELCDRIGSLHAPYRADLEGLQHFARAVKIFAQATRLRQLVGDPAYPLDADVTVEWGLVVDGVARPLAHDGELLTPGQRIYVRVRNDGDAPVYVSLLDIGISGRITLIYRATPGGRLLNKGRVLTLGLDEMTQALVGVELSWPKDLEPARARPETILVVLTSEPQNLLALEQPGIVQARSASRGDSASRGGESSRSPLQNIIDQLGTGNMRDCGAEGSAAVQYDIRGIDFEMTLASPGTLPAARRSISADLLSQAPR